MATPEPQAPQSGSTHAPSRPMSLVGERKIPDAPGALPPNSFQTMLSQTTGTTTPPSDEFIHRAAWKAGVMGAINVLVLVLSARLIVLVGVAGAIVLTIQALESPDLYRLGALGIYCVAVVCPSIWLAHSR